MRREYQEWLAKDLVVDTRETWKQWLKRQRQFGEVPLVPRDELEERYQPHASLYNKMVNLAAGVKLNAPTSGRREQQVTELTQQHDKKGKKGETPMVRTFEIEAKVKYSNQIIGESKSSQRMRILPEDPQPGQDSSSKPSARKNQINDLLAQDDRNRGDDYGEEDEEDKEDENEFTTQMVSRGLFKIN